SVMPRAGARSVVVMCVAGIVGAGARATARMMGIVAAPVSIRRRKVSRIVAARMSIAILVVPKVQPLIGGSQTGREHQSEKGQQEGSHAPQDRQTEFETFFLHGTSVELAWCQGHRKLPTGLICGIWAKGMGGLFHRGTGSVPSREGRKS